VGPTDQSQHFLVARVVTQDEHNHDCWLGLVSFAMGLIQSVDGTQHALCGTHFPRFFPELFSSFGNEHHGITFGFS
jgi:hypothetical protein